jgi:hypothetical protein
VTSLRRTPRLPRCGFCGVEFTPEFANRGSLYCCRSHRQRAYEQRQTDSQLAVLRKANRALRAENGFLRSELFRLDPHWEDE